MMNDTNELLESEIWVIKANSYQSDIEVVYEKDDLQNEILELIYSFGERELELLKDVVLPNGFDLPNVETTVKNYRRLHKLVLNGNYSAVLDVYWLLPDNRTRLLYALNLWDTQKHIKNFEEIWGSVLKNIWVGGKSGSLLMQARINPQLLVNMFTIADKSSLMNSKDLDIFYNLPENIEVWRGVSEASTYKWEGISWSTNPKQAKWFALRNIQNLEKAHLLHGFVNKINVLAAFSNEWEIVVNPFNETIQLIDSQIFENSENLKMEDLQKHIRKDNLSVI